MRTAGLWAHVNIHLWLCITDVVNKVELYNFSIRILHASNTKN